MSTIVHRHSIFLEMEKVQYDGSKSDDEGESPSISLSVVNEVIGNPPPGLTQTPPSSNIKAENITDSFPPSPLSTSKFNVKAGEFVPMWGYSPTSSAGNPTLNASRLPAWQSGGTFDPFVNQSYNPFLFPPLSQGPPVVSQPPLTTLVSQPVSQATIVSTTTPVKPLECEKCRSELLIVKSTCLHKICYMCIKSYMRPSQPGGHKTSPCCPICKTTYKKDLWEKASIADIEETTFVEKYLEKCKKEKVEYIHLYAGKGGGWWCYDYDTNKILASIKGGITTITITGRQLKIDLNKLEQRSVSNGMNRNIKRVAVSEFKPETIKGVAGVFK